MLLKQERKNWYCISKINNTFTDNEDLDLAVQMYNLLEYSENYSITSGSFWIYYWDEVNDDANENNAACIKITTKQ